MRSHTIVLYFHRKKRRKIPFRLSRKVIKLFRVLRLKPKHRLYPVGDRVATWLQSGCGRCTYPVLFDKLFTAFLGYQLGFAIQLSSAFFYTGQESVLLHLNLQVKQVIRGFSLKILHSIGRFGKLWYHSWSCTFPIEMSNTMTDSLEGHSISSLLSASILCALYFSKKRRILSA